MVLDECLEFPATEERASESLDRTLRWARRSKEAYEYAPYTTHHKNWSANWRTSRHLQASILIPCLKKDVPVSDLNPKSKTLVVILGSAPIRT